MRRGTLRGTCKGCGGPTKVKEGYKTVFQVYCSNVCSKRAIANCWQVGPCPVEGCKGALRRSSIALCYTHWLRVPLPLRTRLAQAFETYKQAGVSERSEALSAFNELREQCIAAAQGSGDELERKRRVRRRARQRALAA